MTSTRGRIVILESADPMDLLQARSESQTLAAACKLVGYETATFTIRSARELDETIAYISTITQDHDANASSVPLVVHVSCHGNDDGLAFGPDFVFWKDLAKTIEPLCRMESYDAGFVLSISACGAGKQNFTSTLTNPIGLGDGVKPPRYVFVTFDDEVGWEDATVSWVSLYHKLGGSVLPSPVAIRNTLVAIKTLTDVDLRYFRWDSVNSHYKISKSKG